MYYTFQDKRVQLQSYHEMWYNITSPEGAKVWFKVWTGQKDAHELKGTLRAGQESLEREELQLVDLLHEVSLIFDGLQYKLQDLDMQV